MELQLQNVVVEMVIIYELTVKHVVVSRENIVNRFIFVRNTKEIPQQNNFRFDIRMSNLL